MDDLFDDMFDDDDIDFDDIMFNTNFSNSITSIGNGQGSNKLITNGVAQPNTVIKEKNPAPLAILPEMPMSLPTTVMGRGGLPVIVQDPVKFKRDITMMVMSQMTAGYMDEEEFEILKLEATMIEIATVNQLRKAADGDRQSFECIMDRVLGKSVNQTKSVSMTMSYEDMLAQCDADEEVVPDDIIDVSVVGRT
jgi:hypothetical protein